MLTSLFVQNVVLIDRLSVDFTSGLTVMTGETGAGKSIVLDALALALGARSDTKLIRVGTEQASVVASFDVPPTDGVWTLLKEQGFDDTSAPLMLKRTLSKDGKTKAFINDQPVSLSLLKAVGDQLVEIQGQFATHGLLNPTTHLAVLDAFAGVDTTACARLYHAWKAAQKATEHAADIIANAKKEEDYLRHAIDELETVNPVVGEEEKLTAERTTLMNAEKIAQSLNTAYGLISGDSGLGRQAYLLMRELEKANRLCDGRLDNLLQTISQAQSLLQDGEALLSEEAYKFEDPTSALEALEGRFFALKDLARKYQTTVDELPSVLANFKEQIQLLNRGEDELIALQKAQAEARLAFLSEAQKLSAARKKAAAKLDKAVCAELPDLKLGKATFETQVQDLAEDEAGENGLNKVLFCVSINKGAPMTPLHKTASGGELARFMLALRVNLNEQKGLSTLIFDEVDSGVGGATAYAVGQRLKKLAQTQQVVVITHSPQVAAFGVQHLCVSKEDTGGATLAHVQVLSPTEREEEIARMLSGSHITESARHNAHELVEKACL